MTDPKIDDILIYSDVKVNKRLNKPAEFLVDLITTYNEMQFWQWLAPEIQCSIYYVLLSIYTLKARFYGHRFIGKPRFSGQNYYDGTLVFSNSGNFNIADTSGGIFASKGSAIRWARNWTELNSQASIDINVPIHIFSKLLMPFIASIYWNNVYRREEALAIKRMIVWRRTILEKQPSSAKKTVWKPHFTGKLQYCGTMCYDRFFR